MRHSLHLFGRPRLEDGSGSRILLSPSAWRLIIVLASSTDHVRRKELVELIWPQGKLGTLRKLVWDIRKVARDHGFSLITGDEVAIGLSDTVYCDVRDLASPHPERDPVEIHQGSFAEGIEADHPAWTAWISAERERLTALYVERATSRLQDPTLGIVTQWNAAQRVLVLDPRNEAAVRAKMLGDAISGKTEAVEQTYLALRSRLDQVGAHPESATTDLFFRLTSPHRVADVRAEASKDPQVPTICILKPHARRQRPGLRVAQSLVVDVTIGLCRISLFRVVAPHSAWQMTGVGDTDRLLDLHARYVVETELLEHASGQDQVVLTLYAFPSRHILWTDKVPVTGDQTVEAYNVMTGGILQSLLHTIDSAELKAFSLDAEPSSYALYLAGQTSLASLDLKTLRKGRHHLRRAFRASPHFSPTASALARSYQLEWILTARGDADLLDQAERYARQAISADPYEARGYRELGFCSLYTKKYDYAIHQYEKAERLNPQYADLVADCADGLLHFGEVDAALRKINRAIDLNPLCQDTYMWTLGAAQYFLGQYGDAIRTLTSMSDQVPIQRLLAAAYAMHGDTQDAARCRSEAMKTYPDMKVEAWVNIIPIRDSRQAQHYKDGLRAAGFN